MKSVKKRKYLYMIIVILMLQILIPAITVINQSVLTLKSEAATEYPDAVGFEFENYNDEIRFWVKIDTH